MFAAAHYAALVVFVVSCWGAGRAVLARLAPPPRRDAWLEAAVAVALGIGFFICAFQALAIFGVFKVQATLALVAAGVVAAALQLPAWLRERRALQAGAVVAPWRWADRVAMVALALVALPALVAPLAPPAAFDELMYHLPYAREVAQNGSLGIHAWLRYPWFPYNFNLLYAAALQVGDDVLPHFLNGLAGVLSVVMLLRLGTLHVSRLTGLIGAAIWLGLGDYANALIDMGVALFVLTACVSLWWWRESEPTVHAGARWLALAAFCLGLAAGSKYQALVFLPLVALFVVRYERRPKVWALALLCFVIPCLYWYARNFVMTGDPFNPIGARVFGFTEWVPADYVRQVDDVRAHAAMPNALLWSVLLVPFSAFWKRSAAVRAAGWFCIYSVAVWVVTSRYPRYLMASFPLLALTAAMGWQVLFGWIASGARRVFGGKRVQGDAGVDADVDVGTVSNGALSRNTARAGARVGDWVAVLLLAVLAAVSVRQTALKVAMISPTPEAREAFLRKNVPGYAVMDYMRQHATGRVYQVALSEAIYYGPNPIWGDTLGPWRYADFLLPPAEMARKLGQQGFTGLVMSPAMVPIYTVLPGFDTHFTLLLEKDGSRAYSILPSAAP
jgi:hypothetical protein